MEQEPKIVKEIALTDLEKSVFDYINIWSKEHSGPPSSKTIAKEFILSRGCIDKVRRSIQTKKGFRPGSV